MKPYWSSWNGKCGVLGSGSDYTAFLDHIGIASVGNTTLQNLLRSHTIKWYFDACWFWMCDVMMYRCGYWWTLRSVSQCLRQHDMDDSFRRSHFSKSHRIFSFSIMLSSDEILKMWVKKLHCFIFWKWRQSLNCGDFWDWNMPMNSFSRWITVTMRNRCGSISIKYNNSFSNIISPSMQRHVTFSYSFDIETTKRISQVNRNWWIFNCLVLISHC
jgi:hypothetical protein